MQEHDPAVGNNFESCPAATGTRAGCQSFPDGAHRCGNDRGHANRHVCTDGVEWTAAMANPIPLPDNRFRGETK